MSLPEPELRSSTSAEETVARFDTADAAAKYARSLVGTATHARELRSIASALETVPRGGSVLDLPCGTGRLLPALLSWGFRVTEADSSPHMVNRARELAKNLTLHIEDNAFVVTSVFETGFPDASFDAIVSNRLFHHFREADVRRSALRELRRISRGPIVASFFSSKSIDALIFRSRNILRGRKPSDRIPIAPGVFEEDARAVGLRVDRWIAPRPWISKQCYAVLVKS